MKSSELSRKQQRKEKRKQKKETKNQHYNKNIYKFQEIPPQNPEPEKKPIKSKLISKKKNESKIPKLEKNKKISEEDKLIKHYSKKLGIEENDAKGLKKFQKEVIYKDGLDADLFGFLDNIHKSASNPLDKYIPREESLNENESDNEMNTIIDEEINSNEENNEIDNENIELEEEDMYDDEEINSNEINEDDFQENEEDYEEKEDFNNDDIVNIEKKNINLYNNITKEPKSILKKEENIILKTNKKTEIINENTNEDLIKTIQSNLNKLSEGNIDNIFKQLLELFNSNSKFVLSSVFSQLFMKNTIENYRTLPFILSCQCCIYTAIYQFYDNEFFSETLSCLIIKFKSLFQSYNSSKIKSEFLELDFLKNIIQVFSYFYLFESLSIDFMYEFLQYLFDFIDENVLELLLLAVQNIGSKMRKDNPKLFKQFLDTIKDKFPNNTDSKINFLLELLNDLKLNKSLRNDPTQRLEFLNNWLKKQIIVKNRLNAKSFPLGFKEILNCSFEKKLWWIPTNIINMNNEPIKNDIMMNSTNIFLEKKAKEQRFSSELRRQIFVSIMSAEDYAEATQNIFKLKPNKHQIKDVALVVVECCSQEETYNPFYALLAFKLIEIRKEMKFCFQYSLWDQFKSLDNYSVRKICNIGKFSAFLIEKGCLGFNLLKGLTLDIKNKNEILLMKTILNIIFEKKNNQEISENATKLKNNEENIGFRELLYEFIKKNIFLEIKQSENESQLKNLEKVKTLLRAIKVE